MTIQSFTGIINTNGEFVKAEDVIDGQTFNGFTVGKTYDMQIQNGAYIKVGDAVFYFSNEKFKYTALSDDLYIKTSFTGCILTVLEED